MPAVWLIAVIASCVAVGYKAVDSSGGYAYYVLAMSEAAAAAFSTTAMASDNYFGRRSFYCRWPTASYILLVAATSGRLLGVRFGVARMV